MHIAKFHVANNGNGLGIERAIEFFFYYKQGMEGNTRKLPTFPLQGQEHDQHEGGTCWHGKGHGNPRWMSWYSWGFKLQNFCMTAMQGME